MLRRRALLEVAAHRAWKWISALVFWLWVLTGVRPRYLSSKGQDRWIIRDVHPGLRNGFFVEVGAGNGFTGSDSFVLERDYGWVGICVEPNPFLYRELTDVVKRRCTCIQECIDRRPGTVQFVFSGDTSGIVADDTDNSMAVRGDQLRRLRDAGMIHDVAAKTMAEILAEHNAPSVIHYLSVDVEGAEERVLKSFPFNYYRVQAITVERPTDSIHQTLSAAGFVLTRYRWSEGFYVRREMWQSGRDELKPQFRRKEF